MSDGCAVSLDGDSFLLIGGHQRRVAEYQDGSWLQGWGDLETMVQVLGCARMDEHVVVVGEIWNGEGVTEVIDMHSRKHRVASSMLQGRRSFHLVAAYAENSHSRLLAVGGLAFGDPLDDRSTTKERVGSVEEWKPDLDKWTFLPDLETKRSDFGAVALPALMACLTGPPAIPHGTATCSSQHIGTKCLVECTEEGYKLADYNQNSVVCGWGSTWVVKAKCGKFLIIIFH